jgi:hypothetical protein
MAEYALVYSGPPAPSLPWPLFLSLLKQSSRADARERLQVLDSVRDAIASAFGGTDGLKRDELVRKAYPLVRDGPRMAIVPQKPEGTP